MHRRTLSDIILLFANRNFAHFILSAETSCIWKEQAFSGPFIRKKGPFSPSCQEYGSWLNGAFRGMECSFQTFHDILNLIVKRLLRAERLSEADYFTVHGFLLSFLRPKENVLQRDGI